MYYQQLRLHMDTRPVTSLTMSYLHLYLSVLLHFGTLTLKAINPIDTPTLCPPGLPKTNSQKGNQRTYTTRQRPHTAKMVVLIGEQALHTTYKGADHNQQHPEQITTTYYR